MRDPNFTSVFYYSDSFSRVSLCLNWFYLKVCPYSYWKELDLTLTIVVAICVQQKSCHQEIGLSTSPNVFIFERIVILFFVNFLYKNFIQAWQFFCLWEEWRKLEIKHSLGTEVCNYRVVHIHVFTWNVCDEWSLNNSFSLHGSMIYYMCIIQVIEVKLEIYNVSWFECIHYEWMNLFIYTSTYLKVKKLDKE